MPLARCLSASVGLLATLATSLVAQDDLQAPPPASSPAPVLSPPPAPGLGLLMMGGALPLPAENIAITWDPRFRADPRRAALVDDRLVIEGDMVVGTAHHLRLAQMGFTPLPAVGLSGEQFRWPGGVVPYYIQPSYPRPQVVLDAMRLWDDPSRGGTDHVWFRPYRSGDRHFITVALVGGGVGMSFVGMHPNMGQRITLADPSVFPTPHVSHELGHALGLFHEQSRPDRDKFIRVLTENIAPGWLSQFEPPALPSSYFGTTFDFGSVMLYNWQAGAANPHDPSRPAVVSLYPQISGDQNHWGLGAPNIKGPSRHDVQAVERMYPGVAVREASGGAPAVPPPPRAAPILAAPATTLSAAAPPP